jgi:hypothetical protein
MGDDQEGAEYEALKAAREMAARETRAALDRIDRAMTRDVGRPNERQHESARSPIAGQ